MLAVSSCPQMVPLGPVVPYHARFPEDASVSSTAVLPIGNSAFCPPPNTGLFESRSCGRSCSVQFRIRSQGWGQAFLGCIHLFKLKLQPEHQDQQPSQVQGLDLCWEPLSLQSVPLKTVRRFSWGPRSPKPIGQTFWENWGPICIKMKAGFIEILLIPSAAKPGRKGKF